MQKGKGYLGKQKPFVIFAFGVEAQPFCETENVSSPKNLSFLIEIFLLNLWNFLGLSNRIFEFETSVNKGLEWF